MQQWAYTKNINELDGRALCVNVCVCVCCEFYDKVFCIYHGRNLESLLFLLKGLNN